MCIFDDADVLYDSWSPAMRLSSICLSILSMLSSSSVKVYVCFTNSHLSKVFTVESSSYDVSSCSLLAAKAKRQ